MSYSKINFSWGIKCAVGIICLLFIQQGIAFAQETVVYIKLDESQTGNSAARSTNNILVVSDLSSNKSVKTVRSLQSTSSLAQARTHHEESRYLKGIYKLTVNQGEEDGLIRALKAYDNVVAVEPEPEFEILLVPNDERIGDQNSLGLIQAYAAWDITKGSSDILIGVSDTGFDLDHEDLVGNLYHNEGDPINGEDDDGNGYIDDYTGWDMGDYDNDPSYAARESNSHGSNVAGVISAVPNNEIGIAGIAYNSKFLPLKLARSSDGAFSGSYETIVYAADMGCDVINLSWGNPTFRSEIAQSIINYAVLEQDMVVVAAAGNTEAELNFFPASYDHVLSVAMSNSSDEKFEQATWSYYVDLMSPGQSILSTNINDEYFYNSGSSFSSPSVAATAALVKSVFPSMSAIQIMEQIRMTTDDVYAVGSNMDYYGKLGKGRLNVLRAVSEKGVAAMRSFDMRYTAKHGDTLYAGDTVDVMLSYVNHLRALTSAKVSVQSAASYAQILNNEIVLGSLYEGDSLLDVAIKVVLSKNAPADSLLSFRMNYSDAEGYEDYEYFHLETAPAYVELQNSNIQQTIASNANLCYATDVYRDGDGLFYDQLQVAAFMGIAIGTHPDSVSDNIIHDFSTLTRDLDFKSLIDIKPYDRSDMDAYARGSFTDSLSTRPLGILVEQEVLLWDDEVNRDFVIHEYRLTNTTDQLKDSVCFGFYADFNIEDAQANFSYWDNENGMGYTNSNEDGEVMVGMGLLSTQSPVFHAIDLNNAAFDSIDIPDLFTDSLKYDFMTTVKDTAGGEQGNNVAQMLTAHIDTLGAQMSEKVAYAIVFGSSHDELVANLEKAKVKYNLFLQQPALNWSQLTCENQEIALDNDEEFRIYADVAGTQLIKEGADLSLDGFAKDSVLYYQEIVKGYSSDMYKMFFEIFNPEVKFRADPEVYYLGDNESNRVQFIDQSLTAVSWSWAFSNGYFSSAKNPYTTFDEIGSYAVSLNVETELGCSASEIVSYEVKERGDAPVVSDGLVCSGESAEISASNSVPIRVYATQSSSVILFEGEVWNTPILYTDQTYYVTSVATENESIRVPVSITVDPVRAKFTYQPDTTDLSSSEMLLAIDASIHAENVLWRVDNQEVGTASSIVENVSDLTQIQISLEATSENGCVNLTEETVIFATSTQPGINEQTLKRVCRHDLVYSSPIYGEYFAFYADEELTMLIAKGKDAMLGPVLTDTSFYVTNITDYHESNAVELEVRLKAFDPELDMTPAFLYIEEGQHAQFTVSPDATIASYQWYIDGDWVDQVDTLNYTFFDTGNYAMAVVVESNEGCVDTLEAIYEVKHILTVSDDARSSVVVYPVPAKSQLYVDSTEGEAVLHYLYNSLGQSMDYELMQHGGSMLINVAHLPSGIYFLVGSVDDKTFYIQFTKQ